MTDGQTDGRTDGRTEFSSLDRVCIPCSAVVKQFNKNKLCEQNSFKLAALIAL